MSRNIGEIKNDILAEEKKTKNTMALIENLKRTRDVEMYLDAQKELISSKCNLKKLQVEYSELIMGKCDHIFVIIPRSDTDKLLPGEVALYCLDCGVTNSSQIRTEVSYDEMVKIVNSTLHHGRLVCEQVVTDLEYVKQAYNNMIESNMPKQDIMTSLNEIIINHEKKLSYKSK